MPCFNPMQGFFTYHEDGTRSVKFNKSLAHMREMGFDVSKIPDSVSIPCGQCIGCRLERSRQWAIRCVHEASLHDANSFLTLTYNDAHLPYGGTLVKKDFQDFLKRLRYFLDPIKIRYFHCGEYGERTGRPHYHALIFGYDFPDKVLYRTTPAGSKIYVSELLDKAWGLGHAVIGDLTFESAAYTARYVLKKVNGSNTDHHYTRMIEGKPFRLLPEYTTMSRSPGIAHDWIKQYKLDTYSSDSVVMRGVEMLPPRYYDKFLELDDPELFAEIKHSRLESANSLTQQQVCDSLPDHCFEALLFW